MGCTSIGSFRIIYYEFSNISVLFTRAIFVLLYGLTPFWENLLRQIERWQRLGRSHRIVIARSGPVPPPTATSGFEDDAPSRPRPRPNPDDAPQHPEGRVHRAWQRRYSRRRRRRRRRRREAERRPRQRRERGRRHRDDAGIRRSKGKGGRRDVRDYSVDCFGTSRVAWTMFTIK